MAHDGKLNLSRTSIETFIETLEPEDRFEVLSFHVRPTTLFGSLQNANVDALSQAVDFLASQRALGGTVLDPDMHTACQYADLDRRLNIMILYNGMTEQSERAQLLRLIQERPANATVFAIGVGNIVPAKLPNLSHGSSVRVFGRFRSGDRFTVSLSADVRGQAQTQSVTLSAGGDQNPEIERMWAAHRVKQLLRKADRDDSRSDVIDQIVELGESYSIVNPYTSVLVLENDDEYRRWKINRRNALRIERDRGRCADLQHQLERLRAKSLAQIGLQTNSRPPL